MKFLQLNMTLLLTLINPTHTWVSVTSKCLKSFWWCGWCGWKVIIVSALSLSLRDKERLIDWDRKSLTIPANEYLFSVLITYTFLLKDIIATFIIQKNSALRKMQVMVIYYSVPHYKLVQCPVAVLCSGARSNLFSSYYVFLVIDYCHYWKTVKIFCSYQTTFQQYLFTSSATWMESEWSSAIDKSFSWELY